MRSVSAALATHLAGEVVTLANLWQIVRTDGKVFGFPQHDPDIIVRGMIYSTNGAHTTLVISRYSDS